jgi:hypothetical protein
MFARLFLPFLFALIFTRSNAQAIDTVRCGNYSGYGKSVNEKKKGRGNTSILIQGIPLQTAPIIRE